MCILPLIHFRDWWMVIDATIMMSADHLANIIGPCTPAYASMSEKAYRDIETRVKRSAEFIRVVVVPFVLEDFKQFLVSTCQKPFRDHLRHSR